jgi:hypothetical protein
MLADDRSSVASGRPPTRIRVAPDAGSPSVWKPGARREDVMTATTDRFTLDDARRIGAAIGIDWDASPFPVTEFLVGLHVELEHGAHDPETNVTDDDELTTGKIAWAHLKELPDYYTRLTAMEADAEAELERG